VGLTLAGGDGGKKISGTFTLMEIISEPAGGTCSGTGGYDDIDGGLQVIVKNEDGKTLAKGELSDGRQVDLIEATMGGRPSDDEEERELEEAIQDVDLSDLDISYCQFDFEVPDVPASDFYSVSVGRRGELTYTKAEMDEADWFVAFTLGG